jgi:hypothetical protein
MDLESIRRELDEQRRTSFSDGISGEVLPYVARIVGQAGAWHPLCLQGAQR